MSKRIYELFLFDVYTAILKIEEVSGRYEEPEILKHDFMAWDSVIREFEIIGEATNRLIKANFLSKENQVVVDFRNLIIHHYFGIAAEEVWDVIKNDLLDFKKTVMLSILKIDNDLKVELIDAMKDENSHLGFILDGLEKLKK